MKKKDAETASEVKRDAIAGIDDMRQKRAKGWKDKSKGLLIDRTESRR